VKVIILAGGNGTRLWPISRSNYPKQFLKLKKQEKSLFQQTIIRSLQLTDLTDIYIVTSEKHKFLVSGQLEELGLAPINGNILLEPEAKNTLPAITFAVQEIEKHGEDIVAVFSSDHLIDDSQTFVETIKGAEHLAQEFILLFGVKPDSPHIGYGYIKPGSEVSVGYQVQQFKEKPDVETAQHYLREGYLWNSGMFMFSSALFLRELGTHAPEIYNAFIQEDVIEKFKQSPDISVDYGLLEKSNQVAVIPFNLNWSDLGSFDSLYEQYPHDANNNLVFHDEILINANNNFLYTDKDRAVALIGVDDLIVVEEKDALLISKRDQSQHVKMVVEKLKQRKDHRTDEHVTTYRPWGSYTILEEGFFYKIKRITVSPNKKLSYQYHHHRSEHWVVVKGTARVTIEGKETIVKSGESIYVSLGAKHRLENPGKVQLEVIEVQIGEYLGEDDIIRLDDDFGRE
jgi:mannose-1-phosphate guanylyltransferase/mannose-6-phosphate isomerase